MKYEILQGGSLDLSEVVSISDAKFLPVQINGMLKFFVLFRIETHYTHEYSSDFEDDEWVAPEEQGLMYTPLVKMVDGSEIQLNYCDISDEVKSNIMAVSRIQDGIDKIKSDWEEFKKCINNTVKI